MSKIINFPQRQHVEFRRLVFKAVYEAARDAGVSLEDYIGRIYFEGENPELFASRSGLQSVYRRFSHLIDSALTMDADSEQLSESNKAYLCFRIYLHNTCCERRRMPDSDAELYLMDALQEYFAATHKLLATQDELRILRYLKQARQAARQLPG